MASQFKKYFRLNDAACKHIIGDKLMLGGILKECVPEFENCSVTDIENKYIEGEPEISAVGVHPDTANMNQAIINTGQIHGINTESVTETEGRITYDIRFYAMTPDNDPVKIIINVEAQNEFYPGYPLLKRAVYYAARQISSQYGSEFDRAHYENIKKVYSIWICFDPPAYKQNTITTYQITEKSLLGSAHDKRENYDLMTVVMICLGKSKKVRYKGIIKVLSVFFDQSSTLEDKEEVMKSELGVDMPARFREKEVHMGGYSEYILNQGRQEGQKQGKREGRKEGTAMALFNLMKKMEMTIEQAMDVLSIPKYQWKEYRAMVKALEEKAAR